MAGSRVPPPRRGRNWRATGGVEVRSARSIALSRSRYLHRPSPRLPAFVEQARALGGNAARTVNDQPQTSDLNAQPRSIPLTQRRQAQACSDHRQGTNETSLDEMRQRLSVVSVISPLGRIRQEEGPRGNDTKVRKTSMTPK